MAHTTAWESCWLDSWVNTNAYATAELATVLPKIQCTESIAASNKMPCSWYELARSYNTKVVVAPNIKDGTLLGTIAEADAHYAILTGRFSVWVHLAADRGLKPHEKAFEGAVSNFQHAPTGGQYQWLLLPSAIG